MRSDALTWRHYFVRVPGKRRKISNGQTPPVSDFQFSNCAKTFSVKTKTHVDNRRASHRHTLGAGPAHNVKLIVTFPAKRSRFNFARSRSAMCDVNERVSPDSRRKTKSILILKAIGLASNSIISRGEEEKFVYYHHDAQFENCVKSMKNLRPSREREKGKDEQWIYRFDFCTIRAIDCKIPLVL